MKNPNSRLGPIAGLGKVLCVASPENPWNELVVVAVATKLPQRFAGDTATRLLPVGTVLIISRPDAILMIDEKLHFIVDQDSIRVVAPPGSEARLRPVAPWTEVGESFKGATLRVHPDGWITAGTEEEHKAEHKAEQDMELTFSREAVAANPPPRPAKRAGKSAEASAEVEST